MGLGFAAGAMLWMVGRELIPEVVEDGPARPVAVSVGLATFAMLMFQYLLKGQTHPCLGASDIEPPFVDLPRTYLV